MPATSATPSAAGVVSAPAPVPTPVSVVVRTYTKIDEAQRLVESMAAQNLLPAEIVLIDSGSAPPVITVLRRYATEGLPVPAGPGRTASIIPVVLIEIPNSEYQSARALNQAIAVAKHEIVAILSQDAIPADTGYLEALAAPFAVDPSIAGTYGRQLMTEGPPDPIGEKDLVKTYPPVSRVQRYPECWFVNTCSMVRRSVWERHAFSEEAFISEDHEWGHWVQRQGMTVAYVAEAAVFHHHRYGSLKSVWSRHYQEALGLAFIHRRRTGAARLAASCARECASDLLWVLQRGGLSHWPKSAVHRAVKFAALWKGFRDAPARPDDVPAPPDDVAIQVTGLWHRYRLWKHRPTTLKEKFVDLFRRNRPRAFEEFWALKDVSYTVRRGEIVGICGSNGSGKSTMLRALARIAPATHGSIALQGRIAPLLELATGFHPELSGRENIALNAAILGLSPAEVEQRRESIIEFAELGEFIDCPVKTYSAGMYMRLGFSIMTHVEADILLIDEVLAVGDARFQAKCAAWMRRLRADGVTAVIVSHDLHGMVDWCDRVIWMDRGHVAGDGDPREVLSRYNPDFSPSPPKPKEIAGDSDAQGRKPDAGSAANSIPKPASAHDLTAAATA